MRQHLVATKKIFGLILAGAVLITGFTANTEKKDKGDNTKVNGNKILTDGGRVLSITALGNIY